MHNGDHINFYIVTFLIYFNNINVFISVGINSVDLVGGLPAIYIIIYYALSI